MKYNKKIIGTLVVMGLLLPSVMFAAETTTTTKGKAGQNAGQMFCKNLDNFLANSEKKLSEKEAKHDSIIAGREAKVEKKRVEKDKLVADKRAEALAKQEIHLTKIMEKAKTDAQKQAITEFQTTVKNLVSARQTAVDNARTTFRTGLDKTIADRKAGIDSALATMKKTVADAVAKAKADCVSNPTNASAIKETLKATIKTARETFKTTLQNLSKVGDAIKPLIDARKVAFEKAQTDFKTGLEAAKTVLKTKLGIQ